MSRKLIVVDKFISDYYGTGWFEHNFKYLLSVKLSEFVYYKGSDILAHTDDYLNVIEKLIRDAGNEAFELEINFEKEGEDA